MVFSIILGNKNNLDHLISTIKKISLSNKMKKKDNQCLQIIKAKKNIMHV